MGRCSWLGAAGLGWVVPLCLFGGLVFVAFWVGGLAASFGVGARFGGCGLFSRPPPSPPLFFFRGGACLFLPLPSLGWHTAKQNATANSSPDDPVRGVWCQFPADPVQAQAASVA